MEVYLDHYKKNNIIPVSQDISNINNHFQRRTALYMQCGIPPNFIENKKVLEIGPGTGDNSVFTYSLKPSKYDFVDGNPASIQSTRKKLLTYYKDLSICQFNECDFFEYQQKGTYDLVLCEGVIPHQKQPKRFLNNIIKFVKSGGILLITCVDHVSFLSELLRHLAGIMLIKNHNLPINQKIDIVRDFFTPHLHSLTGMSRLIDDWIYDTILLPFSKTPLLSIEEAIRLLASEFEVYGLSPNFIVDWRWYKKIPVDNMFNKIVIDSYQKNLHNLLDYRYVFDPVEKEINHNILKISRIIFNIGISLNVPNNKKLSLVLELLVELNKTVKDISIQTFYSIQDFIEALQTFLSTNYFPQKLNAFPSWFGRGQQYISFIKK